MCSSPNCVCTAPTQSPWHAQGGIDTDTDTDTDATNQHSGVPPPASFTARQHAQNPDPATFCRRRQHAPLPRDGGSVARRGAVRCGAWQRNKEGKSKGGRAARSRWECLATGAGEEELPEAGKDQHGHRRQTASDIVLSDVVVIVCAVVRADGVFAQRSRCVSFWRTTIQRSYIFISWRYPPIAEHVKFCEGNSQTHLHREAFYISADRDRIVDTSWLACLCCFLLSSLPHTPLLLSVFLASITGLSSSGISIPVASQPPTEKETYTCISVLFVYKSQLQITFLGFLLQSFVTHHRIPYSVLLWLKRTTRQFFLDPSISPEIHSWISSCRLPNKSSICLFVLCSLNFYPLSPFIPFLNFSFIRVLFETICHTIEEISHFSE